MSNLKELKMKIKGFKKKKYPMVKGVYMGGISEWKEGNAFYIFIDTDNKSLEIINFMDEASLTLSRIKDVAAVTEKEIEEYEKNRVGAGIVTTALLGPVAGLVVGLNKKKKSKATYNTFLSILYEDKLGNDNTLIFRTPSATNTSLYFNKFIKALKPYLPIQEEVHSKIEL